MKRNVIAALTLATVVVGTAAWAQDDNATTSQGSVLVRNEGGYSARFSVAYNPSNGGKRVTKKSGDFGIGAQKAINIPAGSKNIYVKVEENTGVQWSTVFTKEFTAPEVKCYKVYGTTLQPKHKSINCP